MQPQAKRTTYLQRSRHLIVFSTLAEYQTKFWIDVASFLAGKGEKVVFFSFDDRSSRLIEGAGFEQYNIPQLARGFIDTELPHDVFQRFEIDKINYWMSHERIAFGINDTEKLSRKFASYLKAIDSVVEKIGDDIVFVQELGGFLSVVSIYLVALHRKINNWFIEPSFFRGRLFYNLNSFSAAKVTEFPSQSTDIVREYLEETLSSKMIVIPKKDKHQYQSAFKKVVNFRNLLKLFEKMFRKYVLREHQEFGFIFKYVLMHISQLVNSWLLRRHYFDFSKVERGDKSVYFPLHVPGDAALTLRSPQFLDQIALIDLIARNLPYGTFLYVKEHPAQVGAIKNSQIAPLLKRYDNVRLISPRVNNFEILNKVNVVVSINSKAGAEAIALGKEVLVFGDAFYSESTFVTRLLDFGSLHDSLFRLLNFSVGKIQSDILNYFEGVWVRSTPGELYDSSSENVSDFGFGLLSKIK